MKFIGSFIETCMKLRTFFLKSEISQIRKHVIDICEKISDNKFDVMI